MKKIIRFLPEIAVFFLGLFYLRYLIIPNHPFPAPPPDSITSTEPADTEVSYRRAYFTKYTRDQVIEHYKSQLAYLPTVRLNYPPEEAPRIIRDQTKSWYLEELVHPMRTSIFINGFIPQRPSDVILINGENYYQKITILYNPSSRFERLLVGGLTVVFFVVFVSFIKRLAVIIRSNIKHAKKRN